MHHRVDVEHVFVPPKSVHRTPGPNRVGRLADQWGKNGVLDQYVGLIVSFQKGGEWGHLFDAKQKTLQHWIFVVFFQFGDLRVIYSLLIQSKYGFFQLR